MNVHMLSIIGAVVSVAFGSFVPALAEGSIVAAVDAHGAPAGRGPHDLADLFVGLAMIETMAIYCLVIALVLIFANPYAQQP